MADFYSKIFDINNFNHVCLLSSCSIASMNYFIIIIPPYIFLYLSNTWIMYNRDIFAMLKNNAYLKKLHLKAYL